jgi:hypothetical protein
LVTIFRQMATASGVVLGDGVDAAVLELLNSTPRGQSFGNARYIRSVFERAMGHQALRVTSDPSTAPDPVALRLLLPQDLPKPGSIDSQGTRDRSTGQYL